jgi:MerR family copper efflux transcriptional regulator
MNIGQAADASGVSAKMIRHYESIGVIPEPPRSDAGYRRYADADVQRLRLVRHARAVGFGTPEIKRLVSLWEDKRRPAREVKRLAQAHLEEIEGRLAELRLIAGALAHLVSHCHGDERPECPILDSLAHATPVAKPRRAKDALRTRRRTGG